MVTTSDCLTCSHQQWVPPFYVWALKELLTKSLVGRDWWSTCSSSSAPCFGWFLVISLCKVSLQYKKLYIIWKSVSQRTGQLSQSGSEYPAPILIDIVVWLNSVQPKWTLDWARDIVWEKSLSSFVCSFSSLEKEKIVCRSSLLDSDGDNKGDHLEKPMCAWK